MLTVAHMQDSRQVAMAECPTQADVADKLRKAVSSIQVLASGPHIGNIFVEAVRWNMVEYFIDYYYQEAQMSTLFPRGL